MKISKEKRTEKDKKYFCFNEITSRTYVMHFIMLRILSSSGKQNLQQSLNFYH